MKTTTGSVVHKTPSVPFITYKEDGCQPIPSLRLTDEEYGRALQRFVAVCTDIVPIDWGNRSVYLAHRKSKPMTGWWWIGGGMQTNHTIIESVAANWLRETQVPITSYHFVLRACTDYFWKDRQQSPQDIGTHTLGLTFSLEITNEEAANVRLDPNEYDAAAGLTKFNRAQLVEAEVYPAIIDLYNIIFD